VDGPQQFLQNHQRQGGFSIEIFISTKSDGPKIRNESRKNQKP
jgi:hypothetical protein